MQDKQRIQDLSKSPIAKRKQNTPLLNQWFTNFQLIFNMNTKLIVGFLLNICIISNPKIFKIIQFILNIELLFKNKMLYKFNSNLNILKLLTVINFPFILKSNYKIL